jgi:hypothetical protein
MSTGKKIASPHPPTNRRCAVAVKQETLSGFTRASDSTGVKSRLIVSVSGMEKQGKTHFALTAPDPMALFDMDMGLEGVVQKFSKKTIWTADYKIIPNDPNSWEVTWEKLRSSYKQVLTNQAIRTVVVDTATEQWELLRLARFGKLTQVMPHNYGPVNAEYREMIRQAYLSDKNLVLIHKMKNEYLNDKRTGRKERAGFADTAFLVQMNVEVWRDADGVFGLTIVDSRQNPDLCGMELQGSACDWENLYSLVMS